MNELNNLVKKFVSVFTKVIQIKLKKSLKSVEPNDMYSCVLILNSDYSNVIVRAGKTDELKNRILEKNISDVEFSGDIDFFEKKGVIHYKNDFEDSIMLRLAKELKSIYNFCKKRFGKNYFQKYKDIIWASLMYGFRTVEIDKLVGKPSYKFIVSKDNSSIRLEDISSSKLNTSDMLGELLKKKELFV